MCIFKKKKDIMLAEGDYGTGFVPDIERSTDYVFGGREDDFDWEEGFDIEQKIRQTIGAYTYKLKPNDQMRSSSCVAQAWDKYAEVKYLLNQKHEINLSPRFIYSNIHLPNGGAFIYAGGDFVKNQGTVPNDILPSEPATEEHLRDKGPYKDGKGPDYEVFRQVISGGTLQSVWRNIDLFAKAIRDNDGLVFGVGGTNNGTWHKEFPIPPESVDDVKWAHAIYAGKAKMKNGKKYIGILNSWGNVGDKGWQWLGEDYINKTFAFTGWTWSPDIKEIKDLELYADVEAYIEANNIQWTKTAEWKKIKDHFVTQMSRGNYYDYLQAKKYYK